MPRDEISPSRLAVAALFLLALALRVAHLESVARGPLFMAHETFVASDMYMFDQWSRRIAAGDVLGREVYQPLGKWQLELAPEASWRRWYGGAPVFNKAPFYAYLIAALRRLFGEPMLPLALLQVLASAACVPLLFLVTRRLFSTEAGLLAALLLALYAPAVHFSVTMLRDTWAAVAALGTLLALLRWAERPVPPRALAAGALAGLSVLVVESNVSMLALATAWIAWRTGGGLSARLRQASLFLAGAALVFSPVAARNLAVGAPVTSLAVLGSTNAAVFDTAHSSPWFFEGHSAQVARVLEQGDGRMGATLLACYRTFDGPLHVVTFYLRRALGLLVPFENADNVNYYYMALRSPVLALLPGYALTLPLAVVGLGLGFRRGRDLAVLLPVALSLLMGMLFVSPLSRYRATFAGVVLLPLAGHALATLLGWARARRVAPCLAAAVAALAIAAMAQVAQARVIFAEYQAGALIYRAAEFVLASRVLAAQGRPDAATAELRDLARLNPLASVRVFALHRAALIEVQRRNVAAVVDDLAQARALAAGRPELLLQAADAYVSLLGDRATALDVLREALRLPAPPELRRVLSESVAALEAPAP
jgi:4-amino-4-deoxy-L-arabinose transferase-like glycosyltransferase